MRQTIETRVEIDDSDLSVVRSLFDRLWRAGASTNVITRVRRIYALYGLAAVYKTVTKFERDSTSFRKRADWVHVLSRI